MKQQITKSRILKRSILVFVFVILGALIWGIQWATYARPPLPEAINALESNDLVTITQEPWLTFSPGQNMSNTGFIFYPGGRVDPRAYGSLMNAIASEGYLVIVPEMPINMAIFNPNIADEIIANFPNIDHWVIGGHSVGAVAAAQYTDKHPEIIDGLAIWASYPADSTDISDLDIPVISINGSREVRVNDTSIGERKHLLPEGTLYIRIEGGDHHQFGSYEINPEDHLATTSRVSQHEQIIQETLDLLEKVSNTK
ncbi:MAG: alpha/beta hydrolase [Phycisphaerae bacterium]|nr:alpha/beta hydrolase [Phycisphaerae bacterium]